MILRYFWNSHERIALDHLVRQHAHLLRGRILDIGSRFRPYDTLFDGSITAVDVRPDPERDIRFGNVEQGLQFPDGSFDGILCTGVFDYLEACEKAIAEIHRLLKPSGYAILSIPFMSYRDHGDKLRFTRSYMESKLSPSFSVQAMVPIGNGFTVIWDILRWKVFSKRRPLSRAFCYCLVLPYLFVMKCFRLTRLQDDSYESTFFVLKKGAP